MAAGPTYEAIASTVLGSATSTITLLSIDTSYTDLVVVWNYKSNSTNYPTLGLRMNSSTTGYSGTQVYNGFGTKGSNRNSSATSISIARAIGGSIVANGVGQVIYHFLNYANTNVYKTVVAFAGMSDNGVELDVGTWQNTSAITSITLFAATSNDFHGDSTVTIYGIKAA